MRETDVERYLIKRVNEIGGKAYKFVSPGNNGVPDRLVILPHGITVFLELKAPGKKPSKLQEKTISFLDSLDQNTGLIDSKEGVDEFIKESMSVIHNRRIKAAFTRLGL